MTDNRTTEKMCEYCDGESNPTIMGVGMTHRLLFCIRGTTLVIRALEREWLFPQWLLDVKFCPICGRRLKAGDTR